MTHIAGKYLVNKHIIISLIFFILCLGLSSCDNKNKSNPSDCMETVTPEHVSTILGKERQEILELFQDVVDTQLAPDAEEVVLNKDLMYNEKAVKVSLLFEGDILFRIQYNFEGQNEEALAFTEEAYTTFKKIYGDSDTYPGLPDRIDSLSFEAYKDGDNWRYQEYWIDVVTVFDSVIPENRKIDKRVDLGILLNKIPIENDFQTIVFIGGIINSTNTTKLPE